MMMNFGLEEARAISAVVRAFRPEWDHGGVMKWLHEMAREGVDVRTTARAAVRAAQDVKAMTPKAITWTKYRQDPVTASGKQDPGSRRCVECTFLHPTDTMTKTDHGWTCQQCTEEQ